MRAGGRGERVGLLGRRLNARTKRSKSPHARRIVEAHTAWLDEVVRELG